MFGGNAADGSGSEYSLLLMVNFFVTLAVVAAVVILYIRFKNLKTKQDTDVAEIKTKIGAMIREINAFMRSDFAVDVEQSANINKLKYTM